MHVWKIWITKTTILLLFQSLYGFENVSPSTDITPSFTWDTPLQNFEVQLNTYGDTTCMYRFDGRYVILIEIGVTWKPGHVIEVSALELRGLMIHEDLKKTVLITCVYMNWCENSAYFLSQYNYLASQYKDIILMKLNGDELTEYAKTHLGVHAYPTVFITIGSDFKGTILDVNHLERVLSTFHKRGLNTTLRDTPPTIPQTYAIGNHALFSALSIVFIVSIPMWVLYLVKYPVQTILNPNPN